MRTPNSPRLRWRASARYRAGALVASGCVLPSAGRRPPRMEVPPADPGAFSYGRTGTDVLHITLTGFTPRAWRTQRGLPLIRSDGQELPAGIDEGRFTGGAWTARAATPGASGDGR